MIGRVNKKQRPARLWKLPDDKHEVRLKITPILNPDALIKDTDGVVAVDDDGDDDDDDNDDDDDDDEDYHSFNCILYYIYILKSSCCHRYSCFSMSLLHSQWKW